MQRSLGSGLPPARGYLLNRLSEPSRYRFLRHRTRRSHAGCRVSASAESLNGRAGARIPRWIAAFQPEHGFEPRDRQKPSDRSGRVADHHAPTGGCHAFGQLEEHVQSARIDEAHSCEIELDRAVARIRNFRERFDQRPACPSVDLTSHQPAMRRLGDVYTGPAQLHNISLHMKWTRIHCADIIKYLSLVSLPPHNCCEARLPMRWHGSRRH